MHTRAIYYKWRWTLGLEFEYVTEAVTLNVFIVMLGLYSQMESFCGDYDFTSLCFFANTLVIFHTFF